ncbi:hypothetical protein A6E01_19020 (plasmid) [Vibrio breoganii]|uniref:Uncharacterized protein n=1 Tax=Vibrio breoganii TaxID=553239 RepID=A0AAN0XZ20_9VIBR|nr:hypothetical protein [Vibrio breoganii]ANO35306.1 hypothetical protein A6E01_19020 [Vibrio breoganii]
MLYLESKTLGHNRAFLSVLWHLGDVVDNKLVLTKASIANVWTISKSARRNISIAAGDLGNVKLLSVDSDGDGEKERIKSKAVSLFRSVEVGKYCITFEFIPDRLQALGALRELLFQYIPIHALRGISSKHTLNSYLACLYMLRTSRSYVSNMYLRTLMGYVDVEKVDNHALFRSAIKSAREDMFALPVKPIELLARDGRCAVTHRWKAVGFRVRFVEKLRKLA